MPLDSTKANNWYFTYGDMSPSFVNTDMLVKRNITMPWSTDRPLNYWVSAPITTNRYAKNSEVGNLNDKLDGYQRIYFNPTGALANSDDKYKLSYWPMNMTFAPESSFSASPYNVPGSGAGMKVTYQVNAAGTAISEWETPFYLKYNKGFCMDIVGGFNHIIRGVIVCPKVTAMQLETYAGSKASLSTISKISSLDAFTTNHPSTNTFVQQTYGMLSSLIDNPSSWTPYHADRSYTRQGVDTKTFTRTNPSETVSGDIDEINSVYSSTTQYWFKPFKFYSNVNWCCGSLLLQCINYMNQGSSYSPGNVFPGSTTFTYCSDNPTLGASYGFDASSYCWLTNDSAKNAFMLFYCHGFENGGAGVYKMRYGKIFCSVNSNYGGNSLPGALNAYNNFYGSTPMSSFAKYANIMCNGIRYASIYDFLKSNKTGSYNSGDGSTVLSTLQYYFGGLPDYTVSGNVGSDYPITVVTYSAFCDMGMFASGLSSHISNNRVWWGKTTSGSSYSRYHATAIDTTTSPGQNGLFIDLFYVILFRNQHTDLSPVTGRSTSDTSSAWADFSSNILIGTGSPNPDAYMINWGECFKSGTYPYNDYGPFLNFNT